MSGCRGNAGAASVVDYASDVVAVGVLRAVGVGYGT